MTTFEQWLSRPDNKTGKILSIKSQRNYLGAIRTVERWLRTAYMIDPEEGLFDRLQSLGVEHIDTLREQWLSDEQNTLMDVRGQQMYSAALNRAVRFAEEIDDTQADPNVRVSVFTQKEEQDDPAESRTRRRISRQGSTQ